MGKQLLLTSTDKQIQRGSMVNLNENNQNSFEIVNRTVDVVKQEVSSDIYQAQIPFNDLDNYIICAVPYLANPIKETAAMKKLKLKKTQLEKDVSLLESEWRSRALSLKTKTCYSCNSKIMQNHETIKNTHRSFSSCPSCSASNYLLTQGARNKINKLKDKQLQTIMSIKLIVETEVQKALTKKSTKIHYLVGGWLHESDIPYDD